MPRPNAIVDRVSRIDLPLDRPAREFMAAAPGPVAVHFEGAPPVHLNPGDERSAVFAEILSELSRIAHPAYVEVEPTSRMVNEVLVPLSGRVRRLLRDPSGDVEVDLEGSAGRHRLRAGDPDFDEFLRALERSRTGGTPVVVTESDEEHDILDVRELPNPPLPAALEAAPIPPADLLAAPRAVTPERARDLFALAAGMSCRPAGIAAPCIPFLYPDDGCHARAHQMCRLIVDAGEQAAKIWNFGVPPPLNPLRVKTPNHPGCEVHWFFHVATTIEVGTSAGAETRVIDPALFRRHVSVATWKAKQGDSHSVLVRSSAVVFLRDQSGHERETDPTLSKTKQALTVFRERLRRRSAGHAGPPPYANCS